MFSSKKKKPASIISGKKKQSKKVLNKKVATKSGKSRGRKTANKQSKMRKEYIEDEFYQEDDFFVDLDEVSYDDNYEDAEYETEDEEFDYEDTDYNPEDEDVDYEASEYETEDAEYDYEDDMYESDGEDTDYEEDDFSEAYEEYELENDLNTLYADEDFEFMDLDDGFYEDEDGDKPSSAGIVAFFRNRSFADVLIAMVGIAIVVAGILTSTFYVKAKTIDAQVKSFAEVGGSMEGITIVGEGGLMAMANVKQQLYDEALQDQLLREQFENQREELEMPDEEEKEVEKDENDVIQLGIKLTSIQSDLKIKIVDANRDRLVSGVPFTIDVKGDNGKSYEWDDKDKDGVIYHTDVPDGTYTVSLKELGDDYATKYNLPTKTYTQKVTSKIEYKKVDVKEEIKTEAQVNAAAEDTATQKAAVESALKDTVEWVESTKTADEQDEYEEVDMADIPDPSTMSRKSKFAKFVSLNNNSVNLKVGEDSSITLEGDYTAVSWSTGDNSIATVAGNEAGATIKAAGAGTTTVTATVTTTVKENVTTTNEAGEEITEEKEVTKTEDIVCKVVVKGAEENSQNENTDSNKTADESNSEKTNQEQKDSGEKDAGDKNNSEKDKNKEEKTEEEASVSLKQSSIELKTGKSLYIVGASKGTVSWETSNTSVATVSDGTIVAVGAGTATITATAGENTVTCEVTVTDDLEDTVDWNSIPLKDKNGNQLYYKNEAGEYVAATYDSYGKHDKFYKKTVNEENAHYTGWQNIEGSTYFFDKDGNYVTGEQVIQGAKYTFGSDGRLSSGSGKLGIDVSKWNGKIDWNAVKKSGVSYVIIRCGYRGSSTGALIEDPMFRSNIAGARAAGLDVGVYFFTQAVNEVEAVEEASMVLSLIGGRGVNLPVYLDVEKSGGRADSIGKDMRTAVCKAFCSTIQNSGYKAGIYANKTWFTSYINAASLANYKIWLAQYASSVSYTATRYDMWQYTSKGSVAGISGNVDMNIRYN